jgi:hypothetical protein
MIVSIVSYTLFYNYYNWRTLISISLAEGKKEIGKKEIVTSLVQLLKYASREDAVDDDVDILENVVEIIETVALESGMYI